MKKKIFKQVCLAILSLVTITGLWLSIKPGERANEFEQKDEYREGHQTGVEKQLMTWLWQKGYPEPTNLTKKFWDGWEQYNEIKNNTNSLLFSHSRVEGYGAWSSLGTVNNIGGRVVCLTIDPNNANNNLFIGTASGGIWKTTNGGGLWTYVPTGFPVLGVGAITYHPTNSNIILAGTGEVYRVEGSDVGNIGFNVWKGRGTYGIGIIRSVDGGSTWSRVLIKNTSELFGIQEIMYDPNNSNIVYACATDGLYRSTDGGATWNTTPFYAKTYVRDIAINPGNSNQIVISVGNLVNIDKGIYLTTNGGSSWIKSPDIVSSFPGYIKLDNNGTRLYASVGRGGSNSELYMSSDFGATWFLKSGSSHCGGQYWFAHEVEVDPNNADRVFMGGVNYYSYLSSNATTGGTRSGLPGTHSDVHDIEFHPTNSSIVYIANDGGMYKSTNGGTSFSNINNGLIAVQFYAAFAASPTAPNTLVGGLQDNGTVRYNGTSWSTIGNGDGGPAVFHPKNGNKLLFSNDARAVYHSTDAGTTSNQRLLNLGYGYPSAYDDRTGFMSPIAMSVPTTVANPIVMYVASDNLHISLDSGLSFSRPSPITDMTRPIDATFKPAIALAVSSTNRNKVYVSTSPLSQRADDALNFNAPARVLLSTNASNNASYTFANISGSLPDRMTTDFAISKFSDDSVYITMGGFGGGHVYLTPDGGTTWLNRSSGLPDVPFNAILIDPVRPNVIYAACDFGVYVSHNKGVNWFDFNNGFWETTMVMDLQITADNKIVAATHGKGVFRSDLFIPPITLPVTFISFTGQNTGDNNYLRWDVEDEHSLLKYEVERSLNGITFQTIGNVVSRNSLSPTVYTFNDDIRNIGQGTYYYRLKSVNNNGSYFYSDVILLKKAKVKNDFTVMGNPFGNEIVLKYNISNSRKINIQLFNVAGSLIRKEDYVATAGTGVFTITGFQQLNSGVYFLKIDSGGEQQTIRLLKK